MSRSRFLQIILRQTEKKKKKKEKEEEKGKNIILSFNVISCLLFHINSHGRNKAMMILDSAHESIGQFRYIHFL